MEAPGTIDLGTCPEVSGGVRRCLEVSRGEICDSYHKLAVDQAARNIK